MPSTNKTPNINLNAWIGTDKPLRADFVSDNQIVDTAIHSHTSNTNVHLTAEQKEKLDAAFVNGIEVGTGTATRTFTLPFSPKMIFFYYRNKPFSEYNSTGAYTLCNAGIAIVDNSVSLNSSGISINGATVTVRQSTGASGGIFMNLNHTDGQYAYIAFK